MDEWVDDRERGEHFVFFPIRFDTPGFFSLNISEGGKIMDG